VVIVGDDHTRCYIKNTKERDIYSKDKKKKKGSVSEAQELLRDGVRSDNEQPMRGEDRYRSIVENALDGFFQITPEGKIISANPAFARIMGFDTPAFLSERECETRYDLILIDTGGMDNAVFRNAVVACDMLLIPVLPSQYDLWAANDTIKLLQEARAHRDIAAYFMVNQVTNTKIA